MSWLGWITLLAAAAGASIAVRRPIVGLLVYVWLDLMRPHDFTVDAGWFRPMLVVGVVTAAATAWHHRRTLLGSRRGLFPFLVLLVVLALSALLGDDPPRSAARVLTVAKDVVLVWLFVQLVDGYERFEAAVWVIALSLMCLAAYATVQGLGRGTLQEFTRATAVRGPGIENPGPLTDNNDLARVLAAAVPLWWLLGVSKGAGRWRRGFAYFGCTLTVIGVAFTYSRGGFLALMTAAAAITFYYLAWPRVVLLMLLCLGVILALAPQSYSRRVVSIVAPEDTSIAQRLQVWKVGLAELRNDPLLGVGPGLFRTRGQQRTSHNIFIEVVVESGLIGLTAYLAMLAAVFRALCRRWRAPAGPADNGPQAAFAVGVSLVAYLVASLALGGPYQMRMFALIGLALALDAGEAGRYVPRMRRP